MENETIHSESNKGNSQKKEKEVDKRSFAKGALAFVADMPEETMKALMMAFLNGTDVAANFTGVVFNAMTNQSPAMAEAFKNGNAAEFKKLVNGSIQEFSKYLIASLIIPTSL